MPRANRVQLAQVDGGLLARPAATSPHEPRLRGHSTAILVPDPNGNRAQRRAAATCQRGTRNRRVRDLPTRATG